MANWWVPPPSAKMVHVQVIGGKPGGPGPWFVGPGKWIVGPGPWVVGTGKPGAGLGPPPGNLTVAPGMLGAPGAWAAFKQGLTPVLFDRPPPPARFIRGGPLDRLRLLLVP